MNQTLDPEFASALRGELVTYVSTPPQRKRRRATVLGLSLVGVLTIGGLTAVAGPTVAGPTPPGQGVGQPLAPPIVVNSVGSANVKLPPAPQGATYVLFELTCYDGTRCMDPSGGAARDVDTGAAMVDGGFVPLTDAFDNTNAQRVPPLDPAVGIPIDVSPGAHWRLYAVFTDGLWQPSGPAGDGRTLGIPDGSPYGPFPDLVPLVATNGRSGYVDHSLLTDGGHPTLTSDGTRQPPLPVYDVDGTTVLGHADVSEPLG